jgi:hypothetical protein
MDARGKGLVPRLVCKTRDMAEKANMLIDSNIALSALLSPMKKPWWVRFPLPLSKIIQKAR